MGGEMDRFTWLFKKRDEKKMRICKEVKWTREKTKKIKIPRHALLCHASQATNHNPLKSLILLHDSFVIIC
jgi:hypothetical protein